MKAIVCPRYGSPDVLELRDVPLPVPEAGEVRVKVHAASVNDWDWAMTTGRPAVYRLLFGVARPKAQIFGVDVAGVVDEIGAGVRSLKVGDRVYGDLSESGFGSFAEFACASESALSPMPSTMSFDQAAAIPHAAMLAVQAFDQGGLRAGQRVLINGAGGGVGTLGVQIAKQHDVEVTGVDSAMKLEAMRTAGFDHVIDYEEADFTRAGERYDLIVDAKTTRSAFAYARALADDGAYVTVGGSIPWLLHVVAFGKAISKRRLSVLALKPNEGLPEVSRLFEAGGLVPVVSGPYPLERVAEAVRLFGAAQHVGKVIVSVADSGDAVPRDG